MNMVDYQSDVQAPAFGAIKAHPTSEPLETNSRGRVGRDFHPNQLLV